MMTAVATGFRPPINVFLAHPDAGVRAAIGDEIAGTGITVIGEADRDEDARNALVHLAPDVALVTHAPPGMDGIALCHFLHDELPACRVLLLATRDSDATFAALEAGAYGCHLLVEPTLPLVQAIRGTMRRESLPSPRSAQLVLERYAALEAAEAGGADDGDLPSPKLTDREHDILAQLAAGQDPVTVAASRGLTTHVVRLHAADAIVKLSRAAADEQLLNTLD